MLDAVSIALADVKTCHSCLKEYKFMVQLDKLIRLLEISKAAGKFVLWMIPQLFVYAMNFPIQKFLQAQRKVFMMAWVSAVVLVSHTTFSWLFILKFRWGLIGAAIMLNLSWWLIVIGQLLYIFITKSDGSSCTYKDYTNFNGEDDTDHKLTAAEDEVYYSLNSKLKEAEEGECCYCQRSLIRRTC